MEEIGNYTEILNFRCILQCSYYPCLRAL